MLLQLKLKGRVPWHNDGLTPKINSMAVIIDWMQLATITFDQQNGAIKSVITTKYVN